VAQLNFKLRGETIKGHMNNRRNFVKSALCLGAGATIGAMTATAAPADRTSAPGGVRLGNLYLALRRNSMKSKQA
jgi:hypothetical protein